LVTAQADAVVAWYTEVLQEWKDSAAISLAEYTENKRQFDLQVERNDELHKIDRERA
jgi:hypothetical protein